MRNALVPSASTRSWGASASCISRRCHGSGPANSGWSCGNPARRLNGSCQTGQRSRSASATTAAHPSRLSQPGPTTNAGDSALPISSAISSTSAGVTEPAWATRDGAPAARGSAGSVQSLIGTTTSVGPLPAIASWYARAIVPGTSWARTGRLVHTGYSPARRSRWRPVRNGSNASCRRCCCPTTTTSGARQSRALAIALIAFPSPGAVCRFTNAGRSRAIA